MTTGLERNCGLWPKSECRFQHFWMVFFTNFDLGVGAIKSAKKSFWQSVSIWALYLIVSWWECWIIWKNQMSHDKIGQWLPRIMQIIRIVSRYQSDSLLLTVVKIIKYFVKILEHCLSLDCVSNVRFRCKST